MGLEIVVLGVGEEEEEEGEARREMVVGLEKKGLGDLVKSLRALRRFSVVGFGEEKWAREMEEWVGGGRRG